MGKPLHLSESTPLIGDSYEGATLTIADESNANKTKKIHLLSSISIVLSMMTGVGIFIFPNVVLQHIGSSGASLVIWTIAGVVTILAGLCYSELALSLPGSGGELVYLERVYGKVPANLYLLTTAFIKYPAIAVIMCNASFTYLVKCINSDALVEKAPFTYGASLSGILVTGLCCLVVCYSTTLCTRVINTINTLKLIGIALILFSAVFVACKSPYKHTIAEKFSMANTTTNVPTILISLFGCIATYDGWNSLNVVAGEVHNPVKTMPIAITVACVLAMVLYLLCNVAYLTILPLDVMKTSSVVAKDVGRIALGRYGEVIITVCVVASCVATIIAITICNSRLIQRAASDGLVPKVFKFSLNRTSTPVFAILLHFVLCSIFAVITSLEVLMTLSILVSWFFYGLCFLSVPLLRYKENIRSKFRVPPIIPALLVIFSVVLLISPVTTSVGNYRISFIMTACLLLVFTPLSYISTSPNFFRGDNCLVKISGRLTARIERCGMFS